MSEWKKVKLGGVGQIITGKTPLTKVSSYYEGSIHFVSPADLNSCDKNILCTAKTISDLGLQSIKGCTLPKRTICVSCIGNLGYIGITTMECASNQQINSIIVDKSIYDVDFIYYAIKNLWRYFKSQENQSTTISIINKSTFSDIEICSPSFETQKKISSILSSLDDKIAVNRKICENLEAQAQALFKHWFVDFAPFKDGKFVESELGLIPEGWRVGTLGEIVDFQNGYPFKSSQFVNSGTYKVITIKAVQDGRLVTDGSDEINMLPSNIPSYCILKPEDILLSLTGNVGRVCLVNQEGLVLNQRVCKLQAKDNKNRGIIYALVRSKSMKKRMINLAKGTAQPNLSPKETSKLSIVIPPQKIFDCIVAILNEYLLKLVKCEQESLRLSTLRDTLLPKLMSGQIKV